MRKPLTLFFIIAAAIFLCLGLIQSGRLKREQKRTDEYKSEVQKVKDENVRIAEQSAAQKTEIVKLKEEMVRLQRQLAAKDSKLKMAQSQMAAREKEPGPIFNAGSEPEGAADEKDDLGKSLARMMKDPAMKEVIRDQQKIQIDVMFGSFFGLLNLDQEKQDALKSLLLEKQMASVELGMEMMGEGVDEIRRKELNEKIKREQEKTDARIKELLGEGPFAEYQNYVNSLAERMEVNQFKQRLAPSAMALEKNQEEQLVQAMVEERENFPFTTNFADPMRSEAGGISEEKIREFLEEKEELNRQIRERIRPILTPEQLEIFKENQEQYLNLMKMGMEMSSKMFSSEKE